MALSIVCIAVTDDTSPFFSTLIKVDVMGSAIWAGFDSKKLQLIRYKSGISYGPWSIWAGCLMLWPVAFPWYLVIRYKIKAGTAVLKDQSAPVVAK